MIDQTQSLRPSGELDEDFARIIDEIIVRLQTGQQVDWESYCTRYPQRAVELRQMIPSLTALADLQVDADLQGDIEWRPQGTQAEDLTQLEEVPVRGQLGDFRLLREIGRGGMGVVYEAEQISLRRRVALKILPLAAMLDQRQLQRFRNEAQAAAGLHHTHIVPVFAVGSDRGIHYYAMQHIAGQTLGEVIRERRQESSHKVTAPKAPRELPVPLADLLITDEWHEEAKSSLAEPLPPVADASPQTGPKQSGDSSPSPASSKVTTSRSNGNRDLFRSAATMGVHIAEALDYAHSLGVVHRDIKPANLLLDESGSVWVADFGLAQIESDAALTMTGDIIGTLRYMSPEQALGQRGILDHRTDIYSLGITLYELLTLQPAFPGNDRSKLLRQVIEQEPLPPRQINKHIPRDLETIVLKAAAKDPQARYPTAREFADDLQRFLRNEPIQAKRPGLIGRSKKWSRRHQSLVMVGAMSALTVLLMAITFLWIANAQGQVANARIQNEQRLTQQAKNEATESFTEAKRQLARANSNFAIALDARDEAERQRAKAETTAIEMVFQRASVSCDQGDVRQGLLLLGYCLQMCEDALKTLQPELAGDTVRPLQQELLESHRAVLALQNSTRRLLAGWSQRLNVCVADLSGEGKGGHVFDTALSPDGGVCATACSDGMVHLWNSTTGLSWSEPLQHDGEVTGIAFSPDGKLLASGSKDGLVIIWEIASGKRVREPTTHGARVNSLSFSFDSLQIASAAENGTIRVGRIDSPPSDDNVLQEEGSSFVLQMFPNDHRLFAYEPKSPNVHIWQLDEQPIRKVVLEHTVAVEMAVVSPDGKRVLVGTGGVEHGLRLWDSEQAKLVGEFIQFGAWVVAGAFSPDGKIAMAGTTSGDIVAIDTTDGARLPAPKHAGSVSSITYSADGKYLAIGSDTGRVQILHAADWREAGTPLQHYRKIRKLILSSDGTMVLARTGDGEVGLWRRIAEDNPDTQIDHHFPIPAVAITTDNKHLITGCRDGRVRFWNFTTGRSDGNELTCRHGVLSLSVHPNGEYLVSSDLSSDSQLWSLTSRQPYLSALKHPKTYPWRTAFHSVHPLVVTGANDRYVRFWNLKNGELEGEPIVCDSSIWALAFSPDGATLGTGTWSGKLQLWDTKTRTQTSPTMQLLGRIHALAYHPNGEQIVSGCFDGAARVWDVASGKQSGAPLWHQGAIHTLALFPDGDTLLTGSHDQTARLWDLTSKRPIAPPFRHEGPVVSVAVSPDGKCMVTGCEDGFVRMWEVPQPFTENAARINTWLKVVMGVAFREATYSEPLPGSEKATLSKELEDLGGAPVAWCDWLQRREQRRQVSRSDEVAKTLLESKDKAANVAVEARLWDLADEVLTEMIELSPKEVAYYRRRAEVKISMGNLEGAIKDFSDAVNLHPSDDWLRQLRGNAYAELGKFAQASEDFAAASKLNVSQPWWPTLEATAQRAAGQPEQQQRVARELLERFQGTDSQPAALRVLSMVVVVPGVVRDPAELDSYINLAIVGEADRVGAAARLRQGRDAEAIALFEELLTQEDRTWDRLFLGLAYVGIGELEKAREQLTKAQQWLDSKEDLGWLERYELITLRDELKELLDKSASATTAEE